MSVNYVDFEHRHKWRRWFITYDSTMPNSYQQNPIKLFTANFPLRFHAVHKCWRCGAIKD